MSLATCLNVLRQGNIDGHSSEHNENTDILFMKNGMGFDGEAYHSHASSGEDKEAKIGHMHLPFGGA